RSPTWSATRSASCVNWPARRRGPCPFAPTRPTSTSCPSSASPGLQRRSPVEENLRRARFPDCGRLHVHLRAQVELPVRAPDRVCSFEQVDVEADVVAGLLGADQAAVTEPGVG